MKAANKLVIQVSCLLKKLLTRKHRYLVVVEWFHMDKVVHHKAVDMQDALEWVACYPNECCVLIRDAKARNGSNFGAIVASRGY